MGVFKYGDPASGKTQLLGPKPPCWGTSKYDNEDRECRACGFQHTCRDQVMKSIPVATPAPAPVASSYYSQFQPQAQYAVPAPVVVQQVAPVAPPQPQVVQVKPAPVQEVRPVAPAVPQVKDRYGQFQDPMFVTIKSTPSVMRPQLQKESFAERVAKNMVLASTESALGELLLGVRQFLWAPKDEEEK